MNKLCSSLWGSQSWLHPAFSRLLAGETACPTLPSLQKCPKSSSRLSIPRLIIILAATFVLSGCRRYAEFTLPPLAPRSGSVQWEWEVRDRPVLVRGAEGEWDDVDVLNPSVIRGASGFLNLYSGYDGQAWHTGLAVSPDGLEWRKRGRILSPDSKTWEGDYIAANGTALPHKGEILYWYQGGRVPRIGMAKSADETVWTKLGQPILSTGPRGSWDERGVADPYVIRIDGTFYMYYLGQDRARRQRLGVARSVDGLRWEKHLNNPVMEMGEWGAFDDTGLGEPAVWAEQGSYWMLYTARDAREHRRLGLARSQDGIRWARVTTAAVLSGTEPWNAKVVCDPAVRPTADGVQVWFGGGDRAEPAENLNGQIGYATLRLRIGGVQ